MLAGLLAARRGIWRLAALLGFAYCSRALVEPNLAIPVGLARRALKCEKRHNSEMPPRCWRNPLCCASRCDSWVHAAPSLRVLGPRCNSLRVLALRCESWLRAVSPASALRVLPLRCESWVCAALRCESWVCAASVLGLLCNSLRLPGSALRASVLRASWVCAAIRCESWLCAASPGSALRVLGCSASPGGLRAAPFAEAQHEDLMFRLLLW